MKFWDSSALVPLLVDQPDAARVQSILRGDPELTVWWASDTECASAVARLEREGDLDEKATGQAYQRLAELRASWHEVQPVEEIRETARRLLRVHDLRAGDSLQLAAAWLVAEYRPATLEFVCLDHRLAQAARREGLMVLGVD